MSMGAVSAVSISTNLMMHQYRSTPYYASPGPSEGCVTIKTPDIGDVGLVKVHGFTGKLIGFGEFLNGTKKRNTKFQHSFLYLGEGMVLEAQPGGAVLTRLADRYEFTEITWVHPADLTKDQQDRLIQESGKLVGIPYSFLDYSALLVRRLHLPVPGLKGYVNSTDHMICSQLIAEVYRRIGVPLFKGEWPGYVTPADFYEKYSGQA